MHVSISISWVNRDTRKRFLFLMFMLMLMSRLCQAGSARPISVKFPYHPKIRDILRKKKEVKNRMNVSEDLVVEYRKKKTQLRDAMQRAYERGQQPHTLNGNVYINGVLHVS